MDYTSPTTLRSPDAFGGSPNLNSAGHRIVFTPIGYDEFPLGPVGGGVGKYQMGTPLAISRGGIIGTGGGSRGGMGTPGTPAGGGAAFKLPIVPWDDD